MTTKSRSYIILEPSDIPFCGSYYNISLHIYFAEGIQLGQGEKSEMKEMNIVS